ARRTPIAGLASAAGRETAAGARATFCAGGVAEAAEDVVATFTGATLMGDLPGVAVTPTADPGSLTTATGTGFGRRPGSGAGGTRIAPVSMDEGSDGSLSIAALAIATSLTGAGGSGSLAGFAGGSNRLIPGTLMPGTPTTA